MSSLQIKKHRTHLKACSNLKLQLGFTLKNQARPTFPGLRIASFEWLRQVPVKMVQLPYVSCSILAIIPKVSRVDKMTDSSFFECTKPLSYFLFGTNILLFVPFDEGRQKILFLQACENALSSISIVTIYVTFNVDKVSKT